LIEIETAEECMGGVSTLEEESLVMSPSTILSVHGEFICPGTIFKSSSGTKLQFIIAD